MNSTEFVIRDGTVVFSLDNQWMATMIAKKRKGDFDTYFFVIDTGAMQPSELLSVARTRSSWVVAFGELS